MLWRPRHEFLLGWGLKTGRCLFGVHKDISEWGVAAIGCHCQEQLLRPCFSSISCDSDRIDQILQMISSADQIDPTRRTALQNQASLFDLLLRGEVHEPVLQLLRRRGGVEGHRARAALLDPRVLQGLTGARRWGHPNPPSTRLSALLQNNNRSQSTLSTFKVVVCLFVTMILQPRLLSM